MRHKVRRYFRRNRPVKKVPKPKPVFFMPETTEEPQTSPVSLYIAQNIDSGLSRRELVEQFHEYDCDGEMVKGLGLSVCNKCDYWEKNADDSDEMEIDEKEEGNAE